MPRDLVEFPEVGVQPQVPAPIDPITERLLLGRSRVADNWAQEPSCTTRFCAGLAVLCLTPHAMDKVGEEAWDALEAVLPKRFHLITTYNDHPSTTHADILALFDKAIAARRSA